MSIAKVPSCPPPGSPRWRRARGLQTLSDLIRDYAAIRRPRGPYRTPLPGDLIEPGGQE